MIKTVIIALVYFLIGIGICANSKSEKKNDPGFIAFTLLFWPLILGIILILFIFALVVIGIDDLIKKLRK